LVIFEQLGINSLWLGHVMLTVPIMAYMLIGFFSRTVVMDEFHASGRRVPPFFNGMAFAAASFGGIGFFSLTGAIFLIGFDALAIGLGLTAGLALLMVLFVPYLRKLGAYSLPSFFSQRFESPLLRIIAALMIIPPLMMLLGAEIRIGAEIISQFAPGNFNSLVFAMGAICALSVVLGGMRSLTWTNAAQMLVLLMGLLTPMVIVSVTHTTLPLPQITHGSLFADIARYESGGGIGDTIAADSPSEALPGEDNMVIRKPMAQPFGALSNIDFIMLALCVMLGAAVLPASIMRIGASVSVSQARRSVGWGVVILATLLMTIPAVAVFAKYLLLNAIIGQPFSSLPHWLGELREAGMIDIMDINKDGVLQFNELAISRDGVPLLLPVASEMPFVLVGFMASAGIAAAFAAANAHLIALSSALGEDLPGDLFAGSRRLLASRLAIFAMAGAACLVVVRFDFDILRAGLMALSLLAGGFFVPLLLSIWWRGFSKSGALAAMLTGFGTTGAIMLAHWHGFEAGPAPLLAAMTGVPLSLLAGIAASKASPAPSPAQDELLAEIRIPDGETIYDQRRRLAGKR
jgi:cation/acetate symporter